MSDADASRRIVTKRLEKCGDRESHPVVVGCGPLRWSHLERSRNRSEPGRRTGAEGKDLRAVELRGLSGGQIGWLGSLQDAVDEVGSTMATCRNARAASAHRGRPVHDDTDARDLTAGCA